MEENTAMRDHIFEVIENQIENNDPPETKKTYDRLRADGFDDFVTKQMIGQCLGIEIFNMLKQGQEYNNNRYLKNLQNLPKEPFEDE